MGLLNTLFATDENLVKNFGLFFGDGTINIVRKEYLGEDKTEYIINVKSLGYVSQQYDRSLIVEVAKVENIPFYNFKITRINEC